MTLSTPAAPAPSGESSELPHFTFCAELIAALAPRRRARGTSERRAPEDASEGAADHPYNVPLGGKESPAGVEQALRLYGLAKLSRLSAPELTQACGLASGHAERVVSAFALGRAVERARLGDRPSLRQPSEVASLMAPLLRGLEVEAFHALFLDARHRLKGRILVGQGTLTSAPVHPREVFGPALRLASAAVIVVHNHPSGDPEPSGADLEVTERLVGAGVLLGVPLLDHLVWAEGAWTSLRELGAWPT